VEKHVRTRYVFATGLWLALTFSASQAAEITLVAPGGAKAAMDALLPGFEKQTGNVVKATFGSGLGTKKQAAQGIFDVSIAQPPFPEVLASPDVDAKSQTPLASVAVAVAVKKGSPKPDIASADAVKKMLLSAKSVTYPDSKGGAAAGVSFDTTLQQMGIADQIAPKIKRAQGGAGAMKLVADGSVEIGLTFQSEMQDPGIEVVGPLPASISPPTQLVGFVSAHSQHADVAKALLKYLSSPAAADAYRAQGMQSLH
jgi:molybdate transport system substrate-binding protein